MNYFGLINSTDILPQGKHLQGQVQTDPPIPDDGVYGSENEYLSIVEAVDYVFKLGRNEFSMVELGAGWGPWVSLAGSICKRMNIDKINLVAVEADPVRFPYLEKHLQRNGCFGLGFNISTHQAAIWTESGILQFPEVGLGDHGAAVTVNGVDYRGGGQTIQTVDVNAVTLQQVSGHLEIIDVMHWDIQGAEVEIVKSNKHFLATRVRSIHIGTHSRVIEGDLIRIFWELGWNLVRETPCSFEYNQTKSTLEGMTTSDGELYFRNPSLWRDVS